MSSTPEAFLLLSISNTTLTTPTSTQTGLLGLQCVTIDQDVYLVIQMGTTEIPIDPSRVVSLSVADSGTKTYRFSSTEVDSSEMTITVHPPGRATDPVFQEDLETFESILAQYIDLRRTEIPAAAVPATTLSDTKVNISNNTSDLRGHLVLVNQDSGEVVGEFDQRIKVNEDPILSEKGHEQDPVVIEISEEGTTGPESALVVFARSIPPEQRGWMASSATLVSHAISTSTNLLLTVVTSASNYYISHSKPAAVRSPGGPPPPPPPRALVFLTSEKTKKGLSNVHAFSGQAVKVSGKTIATIDKMIGRYIGGKKPPKTPAGYPAAGPSTFGPGPASPVPSANPPPYASRLLPDGKPALPPRQVPSPVPSPISPRGEPPGYLSPAAVGPPPLPPRLSTKAHFVLSADLILSTLEESTKQFLDVSTSKLGEVIGHKYGPEAAESANFMSGTARNVALVYIDMRGIGRKALIKKVGKAYVKGKFRKDGPEITKT